MSDKPIPLDLVARLARHAHINDKPLTARQAMLDAADEIERLRAEVKRLRAEIDGLEAALALMKSGFEVAYRAMGDKP